MLTYKIEVTVMPVDNLLPLQAKWDSKYGQITDIVGLDNIRLDQGESGVYSVEFTKDDGTSATRRYRITHNQDGEYKFNRVDGWHTLANVLLSAIGKSSYRNTHSLELARYCLNARTNPVNYSQFHQPQPAIESSSLSFSDREPLLNADSSPARYQATTEVTVKPLSSTCIPFENKVNEAFSELSEEISVKANNIQGEASLDLEDAPNWNEYLFNKVMDKHDLSVIADKAERLDARHDNEKQQYKISFTLNEKSGSGTKRFAMIIDLTAKNKASQDEVEWNAKAVEVYTVDEDENEQQVSLLDVRQRINASKDARANATTKLGAFSAVDPRSFNDRVSAFKSELLEEQPNSSRDTDLSINVIDWLQERVRLIGNDYSLEPDSVTVSFPYSDSLESEGPSTNLQFILFNAELTLSDKGSTNNKQTINVGLIYSTEIVRDKDHNQMPRRYHHLVKATNAQLNALAANAKK